MSVVMSGGGGGCPLGRGQRLHRQGVDLLAHSIAQGLVDLLMASHAARAFEFARHDGREEMAPIAFHLEVLAGQPLRDESLDFGGGGVSHDGSDSTCRLRSPGATREWAFAPRPIPGLHPGYEFNA